MMIQGLFLCIIITVSSPQNAHKPIQKHKHQQTCEDWDTHFGDQYRKFLTWRTAIIDATSWANVLKISYIFNLHDDMC